MHPLLEAAVNLICPEENVCHLCERWAHTGILCQSCLTELIRQTLPAERQALQRKAAPQTVISVWKHDAAARKLVHRLKYQADPSAARFLADGMVCALLNEKTVLERAEWIVPVPLHPARERERGYNQAALLAAEISRQTGMRMTEKVLFRTRPTANLARMNREERFGALKDVFAVGNAPMVAGKRILLVDDVFTTGATAQACAKQLMHAGAAEVCMVTACRA